MLNLNVNKKLISATGELLLQLDVEIQKGELIALTGISGSGKTTSLRLISGLATADKGTIFYKDKCWFDSSKKIDLPPQKRNIGFVFQNYALFPNMSVLENLRFALPKNQSDAIISELINIMELENLADRKPENLSGGQQQRVALARALVRKPKLLLLDEALSALDVSMRKKLQDYLLKVHEKFDLTTILVSHDIDEITKLASRVLVLENGKIVKSGTPRNIFHRDLNTDEAVLWAQIIEIKNGFSFLKIGENLRKIKAEKNHRKGDWIEIDF